jgi:adenylate kinase
MPPTAAFASAAVAVPATWRPSSRATAGRPPFPSAFPTRRAARRAPGRSAAAPASLPAARMSTPAAPAAEAKPLQVIISGAPASGKGTQCALIVDAFDVVHLSTGDMLRAAVAAGTELGLSAKGYMDEGALVPDALVIEMVVDRVRRDDCVRRGWLLDGFPRTKAQAVALDEAHVVPDAVVSLDVCDDLLVERVVGRRVDPVTGDIYHTVFNAPPPGEVADRCVQRSDDTEEKARARLSTFHCNSAAIERHYARVLTRVDGARGKAAVFGDVKEIIGAAADGRGGDGSRGGDAPPPTAPGRGMPVAEFVRRAEEAYEKGYLSTEDVNWSGQAMADAADADGVSSYSDVASRLDVAAGDAAAILLFAYIGHAAHGGSAGGGGFADVLRIAAPFMAAWFLIAPLLGAYTRPATKDVATAVTRAVLPVAASTGAGIVLRGKRAREHRRDDGLHDGASERIALPGRRRCSARRATLLTEPCLLPPPPPWPCILTPPIPSPPPRRARAARPTAAVCCRYAGVDARLARWLARLVRGRPGTGDGRLPPRRVLRRHQHGDHPAAAVVT